MADPNKGAVMAREMRDILASARDDLKERWTDYRDEFDGGCESDVIHEVADGHVPVYTYDILALAAEDNGLATAEPELGPAFDGTPTPVNIIAANIYEAITTDLWEYWPELSEGTEDDDEA